MSKKLTQDEFLEKAREVHGDKYDYSLTCYVRGKDHVKVLCKNHGVFNITPNNHLRGKACKYCYYDRCRKPVVEKVIVDKTQVFINKAVSKYGYKYDYKLVEYVEAKAKVIIIGNVCGHTFKQTPSNHLHGFGCIYCARKIQGDSKRIDTSTFISRAKEVHGDTYSYDDTKYLESDKEVEIYCKVHKIFKQTPNNHLSGKGCKKCAMLNNSFIRSNYIEMAKGRDTRLYLIRCFNENEEFYKIGKTYQTVKQRYKKGALPYDYEIISEYINKPEYIFDLEVLTHKRYVDYSYTPKILFGGYTECYKINLPTQEIQEII